MHGRSLFSNDKSRVLSPYMISIHSEKSRSTYNSKNDFPQREFCTDLTQSADRDARRKSWRKNEEERGNEKTRKKCAGESLIRSSGGLSPSSCTLHGEYRLSVVRLGVLHSSKYLGIFEESRVPKKTVYSVRRRDPSRESERARSGTVIASVFRRQSNTPASRMPEKNIQREDIRGALYTKHYCAYVRVSDSFYHTH